MHRSSLAVFTLSACAAAALSGCRGEKPDRAAAPQAPAAPPAAATPAADTPPAAPAPPARPTPAIDVAGPEAYDAPALNHLEMPNGLVIEDLRIGRGEAALPRAFMTFHYRGKIKGGGEFNVTAERPGGPAPEEQAINRLIPGLATGLVGMKEGGRRRLTIPPQLAPGIVGLKDDKGQTRIPPDATLIYVIDTIAIKQQLVATPPTPATPPAASSPAAQAPAEPPPAKP